MTDRVRAAFRDQARHCAALGSPFMARLMQLCADRLTPGTPVPDRVLFWPGDVSPRGHSVPLRLAGALHGLRLDGLALTDVYPPNDVPDDALWHAVETAMTDHADRIQVWLDQAPQTNEVRRSVALLPAASLLSSRFGKPLILSELGASAGLNLNFDRYAVGPYGPPDSPVRLTADLTGPLPPAMPITVAGRRGVDLHPLDPVAQRTRLLAFLWPDQPDRLALTLAALALTPPPVDQGDAAGWLAARLAQPFPGHLHLIYHTIAWQYFPPETQAACAQALADAGARATADAPLAHLSFEADDTPKGAALTLTTWPGGNTEALGRVDFHGRWLEFAEKPGN